MEHFSDHVIRAPMLGVAARLVSSSSWRGVEGHAFTTMRFVPLSEHGEWPEPMRLLRP